MAKDFSQKSITFRPAIQNDGAFILTVEEATMRAYAEALWGDWKRSITLEEFDHSDHYVIEIENISVGVLHIVEDAQSLMVKKLYIEPCYQRRGIGAKALKWVSKIAKDRDLPITLSVLRTNPAINFYKREGFVVTSETPDRVHMAKQENGGPVMSLEV
jgi:GNAT superfamily N-acetyltransferase